MDGDQRCAHPSEPAEGSREHGEQAEELVRRRQQEQPEREEPDGS